MPKTVTFSNRHLDLASFAKCLAHPARIAIVTRLLDKPELCCNEIVRALPLAQSTVSQHLRALQQAGLLLVRSDGPRMHYRLDHSRLQSFCHAFQQTLRTDQQHH
jgi:DNA-binding transcriptional ArsR family regulator